MDSQGREFVGFYTLTEDSSALPKLPLLLIVWSSRIREKIPSFELLGGPGGFFHRDFIDSRLPVGCVRQQAGCMLVSGDLLQVIQGSTPEEQGRFVDKVDQVRRLGCLKIVSPDAPLFTKAYTTAETQADKRARLRAAVLQNSLRF